MRAPIEAKPGALFIIPFLLAYAVIVGMSASCTRATVVAVLSTETDGPVERLRAKPGTLAAIDAAAYACVRDEATLDAWIARAYATGESLWSKGQKDAIHYLNRYALDRDEGLLEEVANVARTLGEAAARLRSGMRQPGAHLEEPRSK
mgnify:CR=1 FL=1